MLKFKLRLLAFVACAVVVVVTYGIYQQVSLGSTESGNHGNSLHMTRGQLQMDRGRRRGKTRGVVGTLESRGGVNDNADPERAEAVIMYNEAVDRLLSGIEEARGSSVLYSKLRKLTFADLARTLGLAARKGAPGLSEYRDKSSSVNMSSCERFHVGIRKHSLYGPDNDAIRDLIHDMASGNFHDVEMMKRGTELKLLITFKDKCTAVLKPMRWGRDYETLPNHYYFNDYERHNSEVASFHLDRLLGFYRVPPVTGRIVNITSELFELGPPEFRKTFYVSPAGNLCFFGACTYYCDSRHSFCGDGEMLEVSLMAFLPPDTQAARQRWTSPYRRSYSKRRNAVWEENSTYCDGLKLQSPYNTGRILLDIVDTHIFDFLTGNMDRHHVENFREFGNHSFLLHMDNGRGFGKKSVDEFSILAPLIQCCLVRESTYLKMAKLYIGPRRLGELLDESLKSDPIYPVLSKGHLHALDRRVIHILRSIARCVEHAKSYDKVIIKDPF